MRTTLVIKDELFVSAKKVAAEKGCSFSSVVNEALRSLLNRQADASKDRPEFRMPIFEGRGKAIDSHPGEFRELEEDEDLASFQG